MKTFGLAPKRMNNLKRRNVMPNQDQTGPRSEEGTCICPSCGEVVPHTRGIPCNTTNCPKCGMRMVRE